MRNLVLYLPLAFEVRRLAETEGAAGAHVAAEAVCHDRAALRERQIREEADCCQQGPGPMTGVLSRRPKAAGLPGEGQGFAAEAA